MKCNHKNSGFIAITSKRRVHKMQGNFSTLKQSVVYWGKKVVLGTLLTFATPCLMFFIHSRVVNKNGKIMSHSGFIQIVRGG